MSHSHMIVQKRYRESVNPDPAVESGRLVMVDGVYVLEHAELGCPIHHARSGPQCWSLQSPLRTQKARDRFAHTDDV